MTATTLVATDRPSLDRAHGDVAGWIRERLDRITVELADARAGLKAARDRKWGTEALARVVRGLEKHEAFLLKVVAALNAGYAIVPNFRMDLIAVRTNKAPTNVGFHVEGGGRPVVGAVRLPIGEGRYVSPEPEFESWTETRTSSDKQTYEVTIYNTTQHAPVDVPLALMKKDLADALHEAMAAKLFDEIGIVRDQPRGDPILIGRIIGKGHSRWTPKGVTFFIGWWFDVRTLES